ncbi:MAG: DNA repair protein RecN [Sphaerochaeta sp.]|nr:DNA repair protein RecN [Sphaerochaeta sp.]
MLERLEIHNYALIEDSVIEFDEHFTVISGETGAGKSIILGALSLLLGAKADVQSIRSGAESATVAASFHLGGGVGEALAGFLEREGLDLEEETAIIRRTLRRNGRSATTICGSMATLADLAAIGAELFDISAQRDHQSLLSPHRQLRVLDAWAGSDDLLGDYRAWYEEHQRLLREYQEMEASLSKAREQADYLRFAVDEIAQVDPKADEDVQIAQHVKIIASSEQLFEQLKMATAHLHEGTGVVSLLRQAHGEVGEAARIDDSLNPLVQRLESSFIEVQDIYESLRDYLLSINFSPDELDTLQSRLALLQRLKKKHGPTLEAVFTFFEESKARLALGEEGEVALQRVAKEIEEAKLRMVDAASKLSGLRQEAALRLAATVEAKLRHLGMQQARFSIEFSNTAPTTMGTDAVEYLICANPGMELLPIRSVASGGELSRIMLAVKTSLAASDAIPTLIFDEVDAGIGGTVAIAVAEQLSLLSESRQVVVITHLASIASKADLHLVVHKEVEDSMSRSHITSVEDDSRRREIARMLSGDDSSEESLLHASKLLGQRS